MSLIRTRWAAIGAAVAVTLGGGGFALVSATNPDDALTFIAITPCRVLDTRADFNVGSKSSPLGIGEIHTVKTHGNNGNCTGIPTNATAVSMNMTTTDATAPTFITVWAAGATQPVASSLNPSPGAPPTPNAVTTELNGSGEFNIYNLQGSVNVFADINGYYVGHDHDDRYYTKGESYSKAEVDAAVAGAANKMIQLPVSEANLGANSSYSGNFGGAGIKLDDGVSNSSFRFSFVLPPDYTTDSTFTFELMWSIGQTSCTVSFQRASSTFARPGEAVEFGDLESTLKSVASAGDDVASTVTFDWVPNGLGARAGDAIHAAFYRPSSGDSCTSIATVHGVAVRYT